MFGRQGKEKVSYGPVYPLFGNSPARGGTVTFDAGPLVEPRRAPTPAEQKAVNDAAIARLKVKIDALAADYAADRASGAAEFARRFENPWSHKGDTDPRSEKQQKLADLEVWATADLLELQGKFKRPGDQYGDDKDRRKAWMESATTTGITDEEDVDVLKTLAIECSIAADREIASGRLTPERRTTRIREIAQSKRGSKSKEKADFAMDTTPAPIGAPGTPGSTTASCATQREKAVWREVNAAADGLEARFQTGRLPGSGTSGNLHLLPNHQAEAEAHANEAIRTGLIKPEERQGLIESYLKHSNKTWRY